MQDTLTVPPYLTDLGQELTGLAAFIRGGQNLPDDKPTLGKAKAADVLLLHRERVLALWRSGSHDVVQTLGQLLEASPPQKVESSAVRFAQLKSTFQAAQQLRVSLLGMSPNDGYSVGRKLLADACLVWLERMASMLDQLVGVIQHPEQHVNTTTWTRQGDHHIFNLKMDAELPMELRNFDNWWREENSRIGLKGWLTLLGLSWLLA